MKFNIINSAGLGIALNLVIYLLLYILGPGSFANPWTAFVIFAVSIALQVYMALQARKLNGGYFSFGEAFKFLVSVSLIMTFGALVINYLLFEIIDPEFMVQVKDAAIEKTTAMLEGFGMDEDAIEQSVIETEKGFAERKTLLGQVKSFGWSGLISVVLSLLIALFVKKNNNSFAE